MATTLLAILAGLMAALPEIFKMIEARSSARKEKADALAKIELDQTQAALADTDRQLDGVQPSPGQQ